MVTPIADPVSVLPAVPVAVSCSAATSSAHSAVSSPVAHPTGGKEFPDPSPVWFLDPVPSHWPFAAWTISRLMPGLLAICCPIRWSSDSCSCRPIPMRSQPRLQEVPSPVPGPVARLVPRPVACVVPGPIGFLGLSHFPFVPGPSCNGSRSCHLSGSRTCSRSCRPFESWQVPVQFALVPALHTSGFWSRSRSCLPSDSGSRSRAASCTQGLGRL